MRVLSPPVAPSLGPPRGCRLVTRTVAHRGVSHDCAPPWTTRDGPDSSAIDSGRDRSLPPHGAPLLPCCATGQCLDANPDGVTWSNTALYQRSGHEKASTGHQPAPGWCTVGDAAWSA